MHTHAPTHNSFQTLLDEPSWDWASTGHTMGVMLTPGMKASAYDKVTTEINRVGRSRMFASAAAANQEHGV
eukprot:scaffold167562_cov33-Tisochrysis_lutea.AAC.4